MKDSVLKKNLGRKIASENRLFEVCNKGDLFSQRGLETLTSKSCVIILLDKRVVKIVGQQIQDEMYSLEVNDLFKSGARNLMPQTS